MKRTIKALLLIGSIATIIWMAPIPLHSTDHAEAETTEVSHLEFTDRVTYYANKYKVNEYVARDIMWCESELHPKAINYNINEEGIIWSEDYGYWQLNDYYWEGTMLGMGWDIYDEDNNLEAGMWLLSVMGTSPWIASKPCHGY